MGSSVAFNLSEKGIKTLNIEQYSLNHNKGSSHGRTRIYRQAYYEDPRYVPMLLRALQSWRALEGRSGQRLFVRTGGLMMGKPGSQLVEGARRSAKQHGLEYQVMSASEVNNRYGAFKLEEALTALYEENAGLLFLEQCVEAFVRLAKQSGGEFNSSESVTRWRSSAKIEVETTKETYATDRLVLCGGPWMTRLARHAIPLECERQVQFWFPSNGESSFRADNMPVFISEEPGGAFFYGIPDVGHGVKVARSHGGRVVTPDHADAQVTNEDLEPVASFVAKRMGKLDPHPLDASPCIYTNTPDRNFVIGPHPVDSRVTMVSACSGHGFKFASVIGEIVADLATGRESQFDISFLNPDRFSSAGSTR